MSGGPGEDVIEARDLRVRYGSLEAVRGVDLTVRRGEIVAVVGPNGAGKTSTIEVLEGFRRRSGGQVRVLGADPASAGAAWRARIGVVLQASEPERHLSAEQTLRLYAGYYPKPRDVDETLELIGLADSRRVRGSRLSGGQQRRLDLGLALIGDPELLFLDEPTTGFDPSARRTAWRVIAELRELGKTIVLSTHHMDEAEHLADRIAVLAAGRIAADGPPDTLAGRDRAPATIAFTLPPGASLDDLPPELGAVPGDDGGRRVALRTESPLEELELLARWARERGLPLDDLTVERPRLEDIYFELTEGAG
jgi:ABC-2 type transport system ATP-binding protein